MLAIYLNYISDYVRKETRAKAFQNLMNMVVENGHLLSPDDSEALLTKANTFSTEYNNAPWWNKGRIVALAIRVNQ